MKRHATFEGVRASAYAYTDHYVEKLMKRTKKDIICNSMETALVWELGPVVDRIQVFIPDEDIKNWLSGFTDKDLCDDMWDTIIQYAIEPEDDGSYAFFQCDPPDANAEWLMDRIREWMQENGKWRE